MNLQFDNLNELEQFLMYSAHIGRAFMPAPPAGEPGIDPQEPVLHTDSSEVVTAGAPEIDTLEKATEAITQEQTRRKRRTKAEIEAERAVGNVTPVAAAAAEQVDTSATTSAAPAEAAPTPGGANPFAVASPATQAILEAPNQSAATLAGIAAMQTPPVDEQPAALISSIDHLRACQSFIQAHGMTKYNASFKDGLHVNIVNYTPEQRAQHVAILNALTA